MIINNVNKVAKQLVKSLMQDKKTNCYGENCSNYKTLIEDKNKNTAVAITLEQEPLSKGGYYSIHYIDNLTSNVLNGVIHTDSININELCEKLSTIIQMCLCNYQIAGSQENIENRKVG